MKTVLAGLILFASVGLWLACAQADTVSTKDGKSFEADIKSFDGKSFAVTTADGGEEKISHVNIAGIVFFGKSGIAINTRSGVIKADLVRVEKSQLVYSEGGAEKSIPLMMVASFSSAAAEKVKTIGHGERVNIKEHLAQGFITIVDFYADWCGPCRMMGPRLEKLVEDSDDIVLRKVDIVEFGSEVTRQYSLEFVPNVWVFDKNGNQVGRPSADYKEILQNIQQARGQ
jgi:thiol-disulfide isomerase/thioredoxin